MDSAISIVVKRAARLLGMIQNEVPSVSNKNFRASLWDARTQYHGKILVVAFFFASPSD